MPSQENQGNLELYLLDGGVSSLGGLIPLPGEFRHDHLLVQCCLTYSFQLSTHLLQFMRQPFPLLLLGSKGLPDIC
jgi:hypothetical protein